MLNLPETRLKPLLKGIGSIAIPRLRSTHQVGGSASSSASYNRFMRHFAGIADHLGGTFPSSLVEIGPGSTLGVGLTGLLCGLKNYYALDLQDHRTTEWDRQVLASVAEMLAKRVPFSNTNDLGDHFFPPAPGLGVWDILGPRITKALDSGLVVELDKELASGAQNRVRFIAPWTDQSALPEGSVDWIMTHSVLEHVDDLAAAYQSMAHWLKKGGFATHLIDFSDHNLTHRWNGHWKISPKTWALIRGRRPYLINRLWRSRHIELMRDAAFEVVSEIKYEKSDGWMRNEMRPPFAQMPHGDDKVAMSFIVARKI